MPDPQVPDPQVPDPQTPDPQTPDRKVYTFFEALQMLQQPPAKEICDRIKELSKEQRALYKKLKEMIPMEDDYTFGESFSGHVRPWVMEDC